MAASSPGDRAASYGAHDRARWVAEPHKASVEGSPTRDDFVRDRARVLHSWALRRLADKTQVVWPGESDFPRTRLTHTLEVAQISREIGAALGCDPDVSETAGLCHDLGHPPFGHNGESALDAIATDIGGFEGNAQSLRLLTRLEPKVLRADGDSVGLNLTRASLDATVKYPWGRRPGGGKFNAYAADQPVFEWIRAEAPEGRRCLEAQVMDWADDVAYSVHDVEDAIYAGWLRPEHFADPNEVQRALHVARREYAGSLDDAELAAAHRRLVDQQWWPRTFDRSLRDLARLKRATSALIGRFSGAAIVATRAAAGEFVARYDTDLVVPREQRAEVAVLKAYAHLFVFERPGADADYRHQRSILTDLVAVVVADPDLLPPMFAGWWREASHDGERLRVAVDAVASLTDPVAVRVHSELCGSVRS